MKFLLSLLLTLLIFSVSAQNNYRLKGKVLNKEDNSPVVDASVVLSNCNMGTSTDKNGYFSFEQIPQKRVTVKITIVGFESKTMAIELDQRSTLSIDVRLTKGNRELGEVEISAVKKDRSLFQEPEQEPLSLLTQKSIVTSDDIENLGALTLVDALKTIPGGWVETRGRKVKQFVSFRGMKYPYPSYSINGIWQKEFHESPYFFSSSNIESIEVIRSSAALLKSLNGLTGVIDVKTKGVEKETLELTGRYGSLDSYQSSLSYGNKINQFDYRVNGTLWGTNGQDDRNGKERLGNISTELNWTSEKLRVKGYLNYINGERQLEIPVEPADAKFSNRREKYDPLSSLLMGVKLNLRHSERYASELQIGYAARNPKYQSYDIKKDKTTEYREKDSEVTFNFIETIDLEDMGIWRLGALYNYWYAPEGKRFYYGNKASVHTVSGILTGEKHWNDFMWDAGIRVTREYYEDWGGFSIEGSGGKFKSVAGIEDQWQPATVQTTTGVIYSLNEDSQVALNLSGGSIAPRSGALNNDGEKPDSEKRLNIDLGYSYHPWTGTAFKLSLFSNRRYDAIGYSGKTIEQADGLIMELYKNSEKRNLGVECEFKGNLIKKYAQLFANVTYMNPQEKVESEWIDDEETPNVLGNVGINSEIQKFEMNFLLNFTGKYENDRFVSKQWIAENGKAPLGDFTDVQLKVAYNFDLGRQQHGKIFIESFNLLDKKYQTVAGFPNAGIQFRTGFKLNLM
ncbi:TonB-dependent receptor [Puteibacter caeruleilacunae]|nr:TonB-dependent receptor [Puteibacter caeruleilacunae]